MPRESWDSLKQAASALASSWHRVVDFKLKTRRYAIGVFDKDMSNIFRTSIENQCVFYRFDVA